MMVKCVLLAVITERGGGRLRFSSVRSNLGYLGARGGGGLL
jgi:hypothetical protein